MVIENSKELIGLITVLMAIGLHVPYFVSTYKGTIQPHPFTWFLWALLTVIIAFAQVLDGAGPGAWGTIVVALISIGITIASLKNGFKDIKPIDYIMFIGGLGAIPLWLVTKDPTYSVILVTIIDAIAFVPTYRKSWHNPFGEPLYLYSLNVVRHGLSLFAIAHVSIATALFPFTIMLLNGSFALFLVWRRRVTSLGLQASQGHKLQA